LAKGYYRDLIKILKRHGCYFLRQAAGDHEYWHNPNTQKSTAVDKVTKSKILANRVLKQLGIDEKI
jgi:hypothetical protein